MPIGPEWLDVTVCPGLLIGVLAALNAGWVSARAGEAGDDVIARADAACCRGKQQGRNAVVTA